MQYWLIKAEPEDLSIEQFSKDKVTTWSGVRNYQARNNLRAMQKGDLCIFYRSVVKPAAVGLARVATEHFQDPTTELPAWLAVELSFECAFEKEVLLADIKQNEALSEMVLLKNSRLSVQPVRPAEFDLICTLGKS